MPAGLEVSGLWEAGSSGGALTSTLTESLSPQHCRERPRSMVVIEVFTPVVQRILKHNMVSARHHPPCPPQPFGFLQIREQGGASGFWMGSWGLGSLHLIGCTFSIKAAGRIS